jgi:hypothetical protein
MAHYLVFKREAKDDATVFPCLFTDAMHYALCPMR